MVRCSIYYLRRPVEDNCNSGYAWHAAWHLQSEFDILLPTNKYSHSCIFLTIPTRKAVEIGYPTTIICDI